MILIPGFPGHTLETYPTGLLKPPTVFFKQPNTTRLHYNNKSNI